MKEIYIHGRLNSFQVSDLRAKLTASRDSGVSLKKAMEDGNNEKKRLELVIMNLKEDLETAYVWPGRKLKKREEDV